VDNLKAVGGAVVGLALCGLILLAVVAPLWDLFVSPHLPWNAGPPSGQAERRRDEEEERALLDRCVSDLVEATLKDLDRLPRRGDYETEEDYRQAVDHAMGDSEERNLPLPSCREP